MSHVFPRHCHHSYPEAAYGDGVYIVDSAGKRYLDGSCGAAVSCLGHSDETVAQALRAQLDRLAFAHTRYFTSESAERLASLLVEHAPAGLDRVYFVSGGSEAVEGALKLARQYHLERGETKRMRVIARRQSYHGNTLGALATGGDTRRREFYEPLLMEVSHISPCYGYRGCGDDETAFAYGQRVAQELEAEILRLGAQSVMAFVAEPVVGSSLGAVTAEAGYFGKIREICDRHGVLLILDEVMCGMGRVGDLFACTGEGIVPDIVCIAKGLGGGYQPLGALLCSEGIYETIAQGAGFFQHGHTYIGHPLACAAGVAVVTALVERKLPMRVREMGERLDKALRERLGQHPHVGDIRGRGLFRGIELVAERESKAPFSKDLQVAERIKASTMDEGLICFPMNGTADGVHGDHILLAPPFILEDAHIDELVTKLDRGLQRVLEAVL